MNRLRRRDAARGTLATALASTQQVALAHGLWWTEPEHSLDLRLLALHLRLRLLLLLLVHFHLLIAIIIVLVIVRDTHRDTDKVSDPAAFTYLSAILRIT